MLTNTEHLGIAVANIEEAEKTFSKLFNQEAYKKEKVASEGVATSFYKIGNTKIELLEATDKSSAIAKYIEKKGQGMHHIAFEVDDIVSEMARLKAEGFDILNDTPKAGADNKLVCFLHPKSTCGVLVELCQEVKK